MAELPLPSLLLARCSRPSLQLGRQFRSCTLPSLLATASSVDISDIPTSSCLRSPRWRNYFLWGCDQERQTSINRWAFRASAPLGLQMHWSSIATWICEREAAGLNSISPNILQQFPFSFPLSQYITPTYGSCHFLFPYPKLKCCVIFLIETYLDVLFCGSAAESCYSRRIAILWSCGCQDSFGMEVGFRLATKTSSRDWN